MADSDYVDTLAGQLCTRHTSLLATAENDLAVLRARLALVTTWIHNPAYDTTARAALAHALGLPEPHTPHGPTPAFEAVHLDPSDTTDWDVIDAIRCKTCGHITRTGPHATLADLTQRAATHNCLNP